MYEALATTHRQYQLAEIVSALLTLFRSSGLIWAHFWRLPLYFYKSLGSAEAFALVMQQIPKLKVAPLVRLLTEHQYKTGFQDIICGSSHQFTPKYIALCADSMLAIR